jgi:hypothetical protein
MANSHTGEAVPLSAKHMRMLADDLKRVYAVPEDRSFNDLLMRIDRAVTGRQRA